MQILVDYFTQILSNPSINPVTKASWTLSNNIQHKLDKDRPFITSSLLFPSSEGYCNDKYELNLLLRSSLPNDLTFKFIEIHFSNGDVLKYDKNDNVIKANTTVSIPIEFTAPNNSCVLYGDYILLHLNDQVILNIPILLKQKKHYPYPSHPPSAITNYSHKIRVQAHPTLLKTTLDVPDIVLVDDYTPIKYTVKSIKGGIANPVVRLEVSGSAKKMCNWFKLENGNVYFIIYL